MDQISDFVDERQKSWCIHCGQWIGSFETSRDHVPSKSLLLTPHPPNLPVVQVCKRCNVGFSLDEEYLVAFLGSVLAGSSDPDRHTNANAAGILQRNPKLRARIENAKSEHGTHSGETRVVWKLESGRINRVILKNARGHAFYEFGEPMLEAPAHIWSASLESLTTQQRSAFENLDSNSAWPELGSRMMSRVLTGQDLSGGWVVVQGGVYRYAVALVGAMTVRSVLFEYLATEVCWED